MAFEIWAAGCSLIDTLYAPVDFGSPPFLRYASRVPGDGGLRPGALVFAEDLARFAGRPFRRVLDDLAGGAEPSRVNLGGPAVVALINAAQLLEGGGIAARFQGARGDDEAGRLLVDLVRRTPVDASACRVFPAATPFTYVFSDPEGGGGRGERMFVNALGAAALFEATAIDPRLFDADVALLGATAIVPPLHRNLGSLLGRVRERGGVTVVCTVFDFLNEHANPAGRWPLGEGEGTFAQIDLLVTDREEALRLSGEQGVDEAMRFFAEMGVGAAVVTQGAGEIVRWSGGALFESLSLDSMPVCRAIDEELEEHPERRGDTTGCGDNFAGGLLASLAGQLQRGVRRGALDFTDACAWAVASGGFACFYLGGTFFESAPGEKRTRVEPYYRSYLRQIGR